MGLDGKAGRWAAVLARALPLVAALAWSGPAAAGWPHAEPAQPLVQAPRVCAAGVVPIDRRCTVVDFADLGEADGRDWFYAFYATHWADRHGRHDRGFPIIFYLEHPATLRLSLWINDEPGLAGVLAKTAPSRPVIIIQPTATYLGFTYKVDRGPDVQRLFKLKPPHWSEIEILRHSDADQAMIDAAMPRGCEPADDGSFDWPAFRLRIALRDRATDAGCGALTAELATHDQQLHLTAVVRTP
jgi:hypothetical protein